MKNKGVLFVILACMLFPSCMYNTIVELDENVSAAWAQVQNQYQRRLDLIPNLVSTVKGYAAHEESVLTEVTEARSKAGGVVEITEEVLNDPEQFKKFQEAQDRLSGALQRLLAVTESYPDLKANENFLSLQDQLEGTENRIATERQRFNEAVRSYNSYIRKFPNSLVAKYFGDFQAKQFFSATEQAQTAPTVEF